MQENEQPKDGLDADIKGSFHKTAAVRMGGDSITLAREDVYPGQGDRVSEHPIEDKGINQYTLIERFSRSRSGTLSSESVTERILALYRDGDGWTISSVVELPYPQTKTSANSDYGQTNVDGIVVKEIFSTPGGRGHESRSKKRYKISREFVESHDEAFIILWRTEKGGSADGSYNRMVDEKALRLTAE